MNKLKNMQQDNVPSLLSLDLSEILLLLSSTRLAQFGLNFEGRFLE